MHFQLAPPDHRGDHFNGTWAYRFRDRIGEETPPGLPCRFGDGSGSGLKDGSGRSDDRLGVGDEPFFGRDFARNRSSRAARLRGGGCVARRRAGVSWFACLPKGARAVPGQPIRTARVPGGSSRGRPLNDSFLPQGKATFRRGAPGGDFRAGGNSGEAGKP